MENETKTIMGLTFKEAESRNKNWELVSTQKLDLTAKGSWIVEAIDTKYGVKVLITWTSPKGKKFQSPWLKPQNEDAKAGAIVPADLRILTFRYIGPSEDEPETPTMTRVSW